jgi:hypothetical protein
MRLHDLIDGLNIISKYKPEATVSCDAESSIPALVILYMNPGRLNPTTAELTQLQSTGFTLYNGSAAWGEKEAT